MATQPHRPRITDPEALEALAHPVRLDVLGFLMSQGPATASECARAVDDTPSNCSYHLRVLAKHGLVEPAPSDDGISVRPTQLDASSGDEHSLGRPVPYSGTSQTYTDRGSETPSRAT